MASSYQSFLDCLYDTVFNSCAYTECCYCCSCCPCCSHPHTISSASIQVHPYMDEKGNVIMDDTITVTLEDDRVVIHR